MSEHEFHRSDFEAPPYSILAEDPEGQKIIRRIILDGEIVEFEVSRELDAAGKKLTDTGEEYEIPENPFS